MNLHKNNIMCDEISYYIMRVKDLCTHTAAFLNAQFRKTSSQVLSRQCHSENNSILLLCIDSYTPIEGRS